MGSAGSHFRGAEVPPLKRILAVVLFVALGAAAQSADWVGDVDDDGIPEPRSNHWRATFGVNVPEDQKDTINLPANAVLDLHDLFRRAGFPSPENVPALTMRLESVRVYEQGEDEPLPAVVSTDPAGARVAWIIQDPDVRRYDIYFDTALHPPKGGQTLAPDERAILNNMVSPGRVHAAYVGLFPLQGAQASFEPRAVHVVALTNQATEVAFYEYDEGIQRRAQPSWTTEINGFGQRAKYTVGSFGQEASSGVVMVRASAPVSVYADVGGGMADAASAPPVFLPAAGGGFAGTLFPPSISPGDRYVYCPSALQNGTQPCQFRLVGGPAPAEVPVNGYRVVSPAAAAIEATAGVIAVQVVPGNGQNAGTGFAQWPPLDGIGRVHMGYAHKADKLHLESPGSTNVRFQSLAGSRPVLAENLAVGSGLFEDEIPWGTSWSRSWQREMPASGPVLVRSTGDTLQIATGPTLGSDFSAYVPVTGRDAGRSLTFTTPSTVDGTPLGSVSLFATENETQIATTLDGVTVQEASGTFQAHDHIRLEGAGQWRIAADRPVVASWVARGTSAFAGPAPGVINGVPAEPLTVQYSDRAIDLTGKTFTTGKPGESVQFQLTVSNKALDTSGAGVPVDVAMEVSSAADFDVLEVVPSTFTLGPGAQRDVTVFAEIPADVDASAGSTRIDLSALIEETDFVFEESLLVRFETLRRVEVSAEGSTGTLRRDIAPGESTVYNVTVTNLGTTRDTYVLDFTEAIAPWDLWVESPHGSIKSTPPLEPGESAVYLVHVNSSADQSLGSLRTTVQAASQANGFIRDKVDLVTGITTDRDFRIDITDPVQSVPPGQTAIFEVILTNLADANDEIKITSLADALPPGWPKPVVTVVGVADLESLGGAVGLAPRGTATLQITQQVPADAAPLALALDRFLAASTFAPDLETHFDLRIVVAPVTGLVGSLSPSPLATVPGEPSNAILSLTSEANVPLDVAASVLVTGGIGQWLMESESVDLDDFTLLAGETLRIPVTITPPTTATPTSQGPTVLSFAVRGAGMEGITWSVPATVAERPGATMDVHVDALSPGRITDVPVTVVNSGNVRWAGKLVLEESLWLAPPIDIALAAGQSRDITIPVHVPSSAAVGSEDVLLRITTDRDQVFEHVWSVQVEVPTLAMDLVEAKSLSDGRTAYIVDVTNTGNATAYDVRLAAMQGGATVDEVFASQILGGRTSRMSVVAEGPATIVLGASHDDDLLSLDVAEAVRLDTPTPWVLVPIALWIGRRAWS